MWAPESIDSPIASTSSSTAAAATVCGGLEQAGVDHLVAGVAQDSSDDLDAAVVPVESDLGDENALRPSADQIAIRSSALRRADRTPFRAKP